MSGILILKQYFILNTTKNKVFK